MLIHHIRKCIKGKNDGDEHSSVKKKINGKVVLMKKNVLDFNDFNASLVGRVGEFLGKRVSFQLISTTVEDPSGCDLGGKLRSTDRWRICAVSNSGTQDYSLGQIYNGLPNITGWEEKTSEFGIDDLVFEKSWQMINEVKSKLRSIGDGEISISAYDTAWVALVPDLNGIDGRPQFPSSLQWIIDNQLADGSWGDNEISSSHDRLINTLACVIALKSWSICPERCKRGLVFLRENLWRLAEEEELMSIGFEVAFPSLIDMAKALSLEFPYDDPALLDVYAKRNLKLERIPKEVLHEVPTSLLYSLEGMPGLDWCRLLKLQSANGSFLFSPSSTAYALMHTQNEKCLEYLQSVIDKFDGGVPNVYPVDLFERIWLVDRLERLGISRYFEPEIRECLDYVYRHWTDDGICWARNSSVRDVDDTAMGFRLLRLHGYDVKPDAIKNFEKDGEFFCFAGQSTPAVTGIYNLNRASQVMFPGEDILDQAYKFSTRFLREKQSKNQLVDKWVISKDLRGEVEYTMDFPFNTSLPRIETRLFLEQYGGRNDTWIGKTLYRMPLVNNDLYLELAKADFNQCQAIHQLEWLHIQKWYDECSLGRQGVTKKSALKAYFLAAASICESDRATERLGWAKTAVLADAVASYFGSESCSEESRKNFICEFGNSHLRWRGKKTGGLVDYILQLLNNLVSRDRRKHMQPHELDIQIQLKRAWEEWLLALIGKDEHGIAGDETGLLLVRTLEFCRGRADPLANPDNDHLAHLTSSICSCLPHHMRHPEDNKNGNSSSFGEAIDKEMQELLQCVLESSNDLSNRTKQTFLAVAKSYYYACHCPSATLDSHITKVLFERVA